MTETPLVRIASDTLSAAIDPYGAELTWLRDAEGRDLMTDADPAFWTGRAPILFPIVGRVNGDVIRVDGIEYPMPKHGFARHTVFAVVRQEASRATFRLVDSSDTQDNYPFHFLLELDFVLDGATLIMTARIGNSGDVPMPVSFGWHPAFAWPLPYGVPRADHRIVFDQDEPGRLKRITEEGLIAWDERNSPVEGRTLVLRDALFGDDALVWNPIGSQRLTYGGTTGPTLDIEFPDTPMLGIWTKPGAHYVCVEPWHGIADPEGYEGEFRAKPGIFELAPDEERHIVMRVTLTS
ncbi:aldose 1-epimerase family protein [Sphingomonas sp. So64.6b]|uniref:aldose 1-epimerase family protein n=1 Tax=Sphingomonas sp. So64.6b TaxID=2997354 RepID=UPI0016003AFD|nr:aldose 1-epimerase family protein [Sphingomonas sp. So64.6b]QNA85955.1 aldose 1-epimerase family protein [Sphingomonas sp. So64.6b]